MDTQTTNSVNQPNNLNASDGGDIHRNMYEQPTLNQQNNMQAHHQSLQQQTPNQHIQRLSDQHQEQPSENISQANTIPIRNIKVDPETLQQPGQENDHNIHMDNNASNQPRDVNFQPDIELGNVIGSQGCAEEASGFNSDQKKATSDLNLKSELIGDFNAFHEQIQTVDPLLLWSMVRSRVVPQVRNQI